MHVKIFLKQNLILHYPETEITLKLVSFKGKAAIYHQNTEAVEVGGPSYLKVRLVVRVPNFPTRRLRHFLDTLLKPCLKHIVNYVHESADVLITKVVL